MISGQAFKVGKSETEY